MVESRVPTMVRYATLEEVRDPLPRMLAALGLEPQTTTELELLDLLGSTLPLAVLSGPLSADARSRLDRVTPEAQASGLIDALTFDGDARVGRASFAEGVCLAIERAKWGLAGRPVVVLGAGNRARAIGAALLLRGVTHLRFTARSIGQAIEAVDALKPIARIEGALIDLVPLESSPFEDEDWERAVVINATPIGLDDENADPFWRFARLGREMRVIDLVHRPIRTALLRRAHRSKGLHLSGMEIIAEQALRLAELALGHAVEPALMEELRKIP